MEKSIVGLDLGYGQVKGVRSDQRVKFQSVIGDLGDNYRMNGGQRKEGYLVKHEDKEFVIGEIANTITLNPSQNTLTKKITNLKDEILKTLTVIYLTHEEMFVNIDIVTGLPVLYYNEQKGSLINSLRGEHMFYMHKKNAPILKKINIKNVSVIPQGVGALYNEIIDIKGKVKNTSTANQILDQYVGVIDIGYKTTDLVVMDSLMNVGHKGDTLEIGMKEVFIELKKLLQKEFNVNKTITEIPEIAITQTLKLGGKVKDVSKIIQKAKKPIADRIFSNTQNIWGDLRIFDLILITGGGAKALKEEFYQNINDQGLNDKVNIMITTDSEYGNAKGYYKYGLVSKTK